MRLCGLSYPYVLVTKGLNLAPSVFVVFFTARCLADPFASVRLHISCYLRPKVAQRLSFIPSEPSPI